MYNLLSRNDLCFGHYRFEETQEKDLVKFGLGSDGRYVFQVTSDTTADENKNCTNTSHVLRREAAFSFSMAAQFIYETWGEIIRLNSSYRSYAIQRKAFINILRSQKCIQKTICRCAPPGYSEHHTGLAIDLENALDIGAEILPAFGWEQSFTKNNRREIMHEPWHWRFVGLPVIREATAVLFKGNGDTRLQDKARLNLLFFKNTDFSQVLRTPTVQSSKNITESRIFFLTQECKNRLFHEAMQYAEEMGIDKPRTLDEGFLLKSIIEQLVPGDRSKRITYMQNMLKVLGYFKYPCTGFFGRKTEEALFNFQSVNKLPTSSLVDDSLLSRIHHYSKSYANNLTALELERTTSGQWIRGQNLGYLGINKLVNGYYPQHIQDGDLIVFPEEEDNAKLWNAAKGINISGAMGTKINPPEDSGIKAPLLKIGMNYRRALFFLALEARKQMHGKFIAITGSSGKTTTKEMLRHILARQGNTVASPGSANSLLSISYNLINAPLNASYYVFESGLGNTGSQIQAHSKLLQPDVAIITSVNPAHVEGYKDLREVAVEKLKILDCLQKNGYALLDRDSEQYIFLCECAGKQYAANVLSFGCHLDADIRLIHSEVRETGTIGIGSFGGKFIKFSIPIFGLHWAKLALAALAATHITGGDVEMAIRDLKTFEQPPGRGRIIKISSGVSIFDSHYNANPGSMQTDLSAYKTMALNAKRKVAILGEMKELGDNSREYHLLMLPVLLDLNFSHVIFIGRETEGLHNKLLDCSTFFNTVEESFPFLENFIETGDFIFIKGSYSNNLQKLVEYLERL